MTAPIDYTTADYTTAQVVFTATPVQDKLWHAVESPDLRIIGFGGGIRGTKTWGTLATLIALCRIYPGSRWHVVRKDLERLKDSTIPSFEKLAMRFGSFCGKLNRQDWFARCANGSEIHFVGENIDRDPELERLHGFETNGFLLEEADELSERTVVKCQERAGTWICPNGPQPPAFIFATFNPLRELGRAAGSATSRGKRARSDRPLPSSRRPPPIIPM